jgi:hypothetical protein
MRFFIIPPQNLNQSYVTCPRTQPPWEFLLSSSRNSLQTYELSRLSHASNLRKEIGALLDQRMKENSPTLISSTRLTSWQLYGCYETQEREQTRKCAAKAKKKTNTLNGLAGCIQRERTNVR